MANRFVERVEAAVRALRGADPALAPAPPQPERLAQVAAVVDDRPGWDALHAAPADRAWGERLPDLEDALEAWRRNFIIRRIVTLTRSYVVAGGVAVGARDRAVERFVRAFWQHPQNRVDARLGPLCDELTRAGEVFPVLFTNRADGMSYLRVVPARQIVEVLTEEEDYEAEVAYMQQTPTGELRRWPGLGDPAAFTPGPDRSLAPLMLHWAINRPVGATRGEGDLTPLLPWARRYAEWLKDRVRLNRLRTRQGLVDVTLADETLVAEKRAQLRQDNPIEAGLYIHGRGEEVRYHALELQAADAAEDGRVLRLALAAGANVGLHYLGEGGEVNYATAREMGEPSARFFAERQAEFLRMIEGLLAAAYRRQVALGLAPPRRELGLVVSAVEVARADNESLARAAEAAVRALVLMRERGWVDDATAVRLAFRFAGEPLGEAEIARILARPQEEAA